MEQMHSDKMMRHGARVRSTSGAPPLWVLSPGVVCGLPLGYQVAALRVALGDLFVPRLVLVDPPGDPSIDAVRQPRRERDLVDRPGS